MPFMGTSEPLRSGSDIDHGAAFSFGLSDGIYNLYYSGDFHAAITVNPSPRLKRLSPGCWANELPSADLDG